MRMSWLPSRARTLHSGRAVLVAALVAVPFFAMLSQLDRPLDGDEGVYSTMARLLLEGGVPYRDLFDNKPPLQYAWFSVGLALFGDNVESLRLIVGLVMSATALCVYLAGARLFPPLGGYVSLAVFSASQFVVPSLMNGPPEALMVLPETAAFLALLYGLRTARQRWFFLAGLLFGLAVLTKPVAIWPAVSFVPAILFLAPRTPAAQSAGDLGAPRAFLRPADLASVGLYIAGGLIALLGVLTPFILAHSLGDLYDSLVTFNLQFSSSLSTADRASRLVHSMLGMLLNPGLTTVLTTGVLALCLTGLTLPRMRVEQVAFLIFAIAGIVGLSTTGYFFLHHYVQLFPALALACAGAVQAVPRLARSRRNRLALVGAVAFFVVSPIAIATAMDKSAIIPEPNQDPAYRAVPVERRFRLADDEFIASWNQRHIALGAYLNAHTTRDDLIHVHGGGTSNSPTYFYADRAPAARYFFDTPLRLHPEQRDILIEQLRVAQPKFIVDTFRPDYTYSSENFDSHPPAFLAFLNEQYELVGTMDFADVYRRIDP